MKRALLLCALLILPRVAGLAPAFAANLPPVLTQSLPALVLASGAAATPLTLTQYVSDPDVPGTAVRITVRMAGTTSTMDLALYDSTAPLTVANFKNYISSGLFAANFFHRSVPGFIIQNGGFRFVATNSFDVVPTFAAILNEPGASNVRGTIAMAKLGSDPNSATSQWFINLADNAANLDAQNGGFTVFGRVLGTGMTVADQIAAYPRYNASGVAAAWNEIPLTAAILSQEYFIETDAALIAPLSYQVSTDDPALLTATVTNGALNLTASASAAGQTTVRLTTTDLEGGTLASSFVVTVLSSNPLIAWRQTNFGTTSDTGSAATLADPDGDGIPNLLEYALGLQPLVADATGLPTAHLSGGNLTLTYVQARADITYTVQTTTTLTDANSWTATGVTQGTPGGNGVTTASIPVAGAATRFLRLQVTATP